MKRLLLILGVLGMVLGLSCSWLDWHNDIEYPAEFFMLHETPGDPITFSFAFRFQDQTMDTSGVELKWEKRGSDTLWFSLKGTDGDIDYKGSYRTQIEVNVGVLENGNYTLLFEGEGRARDTFTFEVEDSLYRFVDTSDSGDVVYHPRVQYDTLRRLFPDMLLVEAGFYWSQPYEENIDSLNQDLLNAGAKECPLNTGAYLLQSWDWDDAFENGWMEDTRTMSYTFEGDTSEIANIFSKHEQRFQALGIGMGNGFRRLYQVWNSY